ncbi:MAG: YezD family protein [Actinomycetota bacterium]
MTDEPTTEANPTGATADEQLESLALSEEERLVLARVADIVRRINYGTVVLVIQDGKVVQIEMAEKFRLR